jgi:medium-chain acyl-[acyl-carrier-protein] hydrolase
MTRQAVWFEETQVKTYETDFQQQWRPACFSQAMQEAAAHHATHLGFGYKEMMANDQIWILSRVRIRFHAFPTVEDGVRIETWPKGIQQRLLFMRDFHLRDAAGSSLADGSTGWLLVNPSVRRILSPGALLGGSLPDNCGRSAIDEPLDKLSPPEGLPVRLSIAAGYSAVDLLGHVTSSRYLDWIGDAFTLAEHAARRLVELQINYTSEVLPGEQVDLAVGPDSVDPHLWWAVGTHQQTRARAFEAFLRFSK